VAFPPPPPPPPPTPPGLDRRFVALEREARGMTGP
jgi:hypothetical protein